MFHCLVTKPDETVDAQEDMVEPECAADMQQLLQQYTDVVVQGDRLPGPPPERPDLPQPIPLKKGTTPIARPPYRLSQLERREVERQIQEGLESGLIEPSSSP